ncbi:restriction endonuclease subunit S [Erythrobacter sp. G21629-S1]|nr:restriction endonuclease subunit S [Erythrobacter sp. G21629-S1]
MTTVRDLFELKYGHSLELNALRRSDASDAIYFVGRAARNNGITSRVARVEDVDPAEAGSITVALGGQGGAGIAFLQPFPFYCGRDVMILTAREAMSDQEKIWWATCISHNRFRFGFGRQANRTLGDLELPSPNSMPEWVSGAELGKLTNAKAKVAELPAKTPEAKDWAYFSLGSLFDIKKGQRLTKANMKPGMTPFVGAIDKDNGVREFVSAQPNHESNVITVNYNGSVAEAFYQEAPFWASDDVNVLYPKFDMSALVALFICTIIKLEKFRFNYGRKWKLDRMKDFEIKLPSDASGEPDWEEVTQFMERLPYSRGATLETSAAA